MPIPGQLLPDGIGSVLGRGRCNLRAIAEESGAELEFQHGTILARGGEAERQRAAGFLQEFFGRLLERSELPGMASACATQAAGCRLRLDCRAWPHMHASMYA